MKTRKPRKPSITNWVPWDILEQGRDDVVMRGNTIFAIEKPRGRKSGVPIRWGKRAGGQTRNTD